MGDSRRVADEHLLTQMRKYAGWVEEGRMPVASRVVPVRRALEGLPWVIPTSQAMAILEKARTVCVDDCVCRAHYKNCDNPLGVCLLLDAAADARVERGTGRRVTLPEAAAILEEATRHRLVHLAVYSPDQPLLSLCSCCPCCCYQLGMLLALDRSDLVVKSDYVVSFRPERCDGCGQCLGACHFGASAPGPAPGVPAVDPARCYGCGLCASSCPTGALSLVPRAAAASAPAVGQEHAGP